MMHPRGDGAVQVVVRVGTADETWDDEAWVAVLRNTPAVTRTVSRVLPGTPPPDRPPARSPSRPLVGWDEWWSLVPGLREELGDDVDLLLVRDGAAVAPTWTHRLGWFAHSSRDEPTVVLAGMPPVTDDVTAVDHLSAAEALRLGLARAGSAVPVLSAEPPGVSSVALHGARSAAACIPSGYGRLQAPDEAVAVAGVVRQAPPPVGYSSWRAAGPVEVLPRFLLVRLAVPEHEPDTWRPVLRALSRTSEVLVLELHGGTTELRRLTRSGWSTVESVSRSSCSVAEAVRRGATHLDVEQIHLHQLDAELLDAVLAAARRAGLQPVVSFDHVRGGIPPSPGLARQEYVVARSPGCYAALAAALPDGLALRLVMPGWPTGPQPPAGDRVEGPARVLLCARQPGPTVQDTLVRHTAATVHWHVIGEHPVPGAANHGPVAWRRLASLLEELWIDAVLLPADRHELQVPLLHAALTAGASALVLESEAVAHLVEHCGGAVLPLDPLEVDHRSWQGLTVPATSAAGAPVSAVDSVLTEAATLGGIHSSALARWERVPIVGFVVKRSRSGAAPATAQVRLLRSLRALELRGAVRTAEVDPDDLVRGADATAYDALVVVRDALRPGVGAVLAAECRSRGTRLVVDVDDDMFSDAAVRHLGESGYDVERLSTLAALARDADVLSVSTPQLQALVEEALPDRRGRLVLMPNQLDDRLWFRDVELRPADSAKMRVLYMGSLTHSDDLGLVLREWEELSALAPHPAPTLELVGIADVPLPAGVRRLPVPVGEQEYPRFVSWLRSHRRRWSCAVAPLCATTFNRSKSDLKLLEYSAMGLPAVASRWGPYEDARAGVDVVGDRGWAAALARLLQDPVTARDRGEAGRRWTFEHRRLSTHLDGWLSEVVGGRS